MIRKTELQNLVCGPEVTIREALSRINTSQHLFQVVIDNQGLLLGTVTDGDVRRAVLQGASLEDPTSACMQKQPKVGKCGEGDKNRLKLRTLKGSFAFLPIVDETNRVHEILIDETRPGRLSTALIMAGGLGSRLGERTRHTPKPLLPVGDKPILGHIVDGLVQAGVDDVYIAVHYKAEQVRRFVSEREGAPTIHLLTEHEPLGTAGAISMLPPEHKGPILVLNGDVLTQTDLIALEAFHQRHGYDATIGVTPYKVDIPFGVIRQKADGLFDMIEEKPSLTRFIAAGVYYLSSQVTALVPPNTNIGMPDVLNSARKLNLDIGLFPIHEYWIDVGRPDDLEAANADHQETSRNVQ